MLNYISKPSKNINIARSSHFGVLLRVTMFSKSSKIRFQISPPSEHRKVNGEWWERYQTVSYMLNSRNGDRASFRWEIINEISDN